MLTSVARYRVSKRTSATGAEDAPRRIPNDWGEDLCKRRGDMPDEREASVKLIETMVGTLCAE
jgi:hypothetical protein